MSTLIASFVILLLVVAGMALGVMFGRTPIKGSCGGLNNVGIDGNCEFCGGKPASCKDAAE